MHLRKRQMKSSRPANQNAGKIPTGKDRRAKLFDELPANIARRQNDCQMQERVEQRVGGLVLIMSTEFVLLSRKMVYHNANQSDTAFSL